MIMTLREKCIGIDIGVGDANPVFAVLSDRSMQTHYPAVDEKVAGGFDVRRDKLRLGSKVGRPDG